MVPKTAFKFGDVTVDHRGECRILLVLKPVRALEFSLALYDPGIGSLFAVKSLRLAVDDRTSFLDDDLGDEGL